MTNTSSNPITVDGVRLDTLAYNVETLSGRLTMPGTRGEDPIVPGRPGAVFVPNKTYDERTMTLAMWVRGADADGAVPPVESSRYDQFRSNLSVITNLFSKRHALLDVRQTWPAGVIQWLCTVDDPIDFSVNTRNPKASFAVVLKIPGVFGQDVNTTDYTSSATLTSGAVLTLAAYNGATAPIDDAIIAVRGPITNPRLTNPETGEWVQLNQALAAGTDWYLNCATWETRTGASIGLAGGGTNRVSSTQFGGGTSAFMRLTPRAGGPQLTLTGSGTGSATQVLARARRKFVL